MSRSASAIARCIRLAREGETGALNDLLEQYRSYLRIIALACLGCRVRAKCEASDVVQETLLQVHVSFEEFRGTTKGEWLQWVRRILVNKIAEVERRFSLQRRRISQERSLEAAVDRSSRLLRNLLPARGNSPSQEAHERERAVILADILAELDAEHLEVVVLRNLQELEWKEIAARTGRSPDAARMLWTRALQRIAPLLKERLA